MSSGSVASGAGEPGAEERSRLPDRGPARAALVPAGHGARDRPGRRRRGPPSAPRPGRRRGTSGTAGPAEATRPAQPRRRATRTAISSGSSKTAVALSPASCQAGHSGPSLRMASAEVGQSSLTNSRSAAPPAVRAPMVTSPRPVPRTDSAGAGRGPVGLWWLPVICLRYHNPCGPRKAWAAASSPGPPRRGRTSAAPVRVVVDVRPSSEIRRWYYQRVRTPPGRVTHRWCAGEFWIMTADAADLPACAAS